MAQPKNAFADWMDVVSEGRNELVFQNRHKDYGAYQIRRNYNRTLVMALLISSAAFVFFVSLPKIIEFLTPAEDESSKAATEVVVDLTEPPPVDETEPPPPPPPPPPPVTETIRFTPPVVVDEEIPEDEAPPVQEEIVAQVSNVTQEGNGEEIIIPQEEGPAVIEEKPEEIFVSVEEMPTFPGGEEALMKYLAKNIQYPAMEKDAGVQGTAYVYFVIDKDGKVQNAEIKRGVKGGPGLDKEALRVIKSMPNWKAGKQNGRPVLVSFTLPVKFVLR